MDRCSLPQMEWKGIDRKPAEELLGRRGQLLELDRSDEAQVSVVMPVVVLISATLENA
jgi:hypothetical protein